MCRDPAIGELLLECREQPQTGLTLESVERAPQHLARTELPRRAFESAQIAEKEILNGAILEGHKYPGGRIGHESHFAARAERRHMDGPKGGQE